MRLGVLPAAGKADRWGGYPKELLPISDDHTFLSRAVETLTCSGCEAVLLVTNPAKIHLHAYHLKNRSNVSFVLQQGNEMWGAMATALQTPADEYLFMMPDTFLPDRPFPTSLQAHIGFGTFTTDEPERFGVFRDGRIVNKQPAGGTGLAWGALAWTSDVAKYWKSQVYEGYTQALNAAIRGFEYTIWELEQYFDIGNMRHYTEFLSLTQAGDREIGTFDLASQGRLVPGRGPKRPLSVQAKSPE